MMLQIKFKGLAIQLQSPFFCANSNTQRVMHDQPPARKLFQILLHFGKSARYFSKLDTGMERSSFGSTAARLSTTKSKTGCSFARDSSIFQSAKNSIAEASEPLRNSSTGVWLTFTNNANKSSKGDKIWQNTKCAAEGQYRATMPRKLSRR